MAQTLQQHQIKELQKQYRDETTQPLSKTQTNFQDSTLVDTNKSSNVEKVTAEVQTDLRLSGIYKFEQKIKEAKNDHSDFGQVFRASQEFPQDKSKNTSKDNELKVFNETH